MLAVILAFLLKLVPGLTASVGEKVVDAYKAKLDAATSDRKIAADLAAKEIEATIAARQNAKEIRLASAGFWEMRLITALIAGCFTLHLVLVTLDTCFAFSWGIAKFPPPFDQWEGAILLSFFGVSVAERGMVAIAAAVSKRRS
ncbi:MAG TPA: hypothetical protein VFB16_14670 [Bauldia sp.]|nr:hypothetical protein [Bauldia sp.]